MTLCFRRETLHQKDHTEAADDRGKQYPVAKPTWTFADVGVVPDAERAVVKHIVKEADQPP